MMDRRENQNGRLEYYHLHWPREEKFFAKGEKIVSIRKCKKPTFGYTINEAYFMMAVNIIKTDRVNMKYLIALLNSKLIEFWLRNKGKMQGLLFQIDKEPILEIPIYIPQNTPEAQEPFIKLVDIILAKKENGENTDAEEKQIDMMVYNLYGLSEEEIEIIEGQ